MVSHCTVGLLVLGSQRAEERGGGLRREGTQRWTGKAAFNLAPAASSQLSEVDGVWVCVCVYMLVSVYNCMSVSVFVCVSVSMRCICRRVSAKVNQQTAQL